MKSSYRIEIHSWHKKVIIDNYRKISLLTAACKTLPKFLLEQAYEQLEHKIGVRFHQASQLQTYEVPPEQILNLKQIT